MFSKVYYLKDKSICDELIKTFEKNKHNHTNGVVNKTSDGLVCDTSVKDSTDLILTLGSAESSVQKYITELQRITERYKKAYPCVDKYSSWGLRERFNIQYYKPGGGYKTWHTENTGLHNCHRHMVWMTYLNDVWIGGGTKFKHQRKTIWARKGKTVIWPAGWTHTHKGQIAPFEDKYVITGWYSWMT